LTIIDQVTTRKYNTYEESVVSKKEALVTSTKNTVTVKVDAKVHAYLSLLAEKYGMTLSATLYKLISEHEPDVIQLQEEIEALKQKRTSEK
jgi:macrodomain Ter protein organizer (MatP/YcbG family)